MKKLLCILVCVFAALAFACDCGGEPVQVPVKLDLNGGSIEGDVVDYTATIGEELVLPDPVKTGYNFSGWTLGGQPVNLSAWAIEGELVTIKASWTAKNYTITLDADGGVVEVAEVKIAYGATAADLPVPTKSGYAFKGWKLEGVSGYIDGKFVWEIDDNATLKAEWEDVREVSYTLTKEATDKLVDAEGNEVTESSGIIGFGMDTLGLPSVEREGYEFIGWQYDYEGDEEGLKTISEYWDIWVENSAANPVALTPAFVAKTYTITIDVTGQENVFNGEVAVTENIIVEVTYNAEYTLPELTRTQFDFVAYTINGTDNDVLVDKIVNEGGEEEKITWSRAYDVTVTPVWDTDVFTLTFQGEGAKSESVLVDEDTGIAIDRIPVLTKTGYSISHYMYKGQRIEKDNLAPIAAIKGENLSEADRVVTVIFTPNTYTATFNGNGGTVSEATKDYVYNDVITLPTAEKAGYTFDGWSKTATGAKEFSEGQKWNVADNITLYAVYTANTYEIKYAITSNRIRLVNTTDPEATIYTTQTVTYGQPYTLLQAEYLDKNDNVDSEVRFVKWLNQANNEEFTVTDNWTLTENVVLVPDWDGKQYNLKLKSNENVGDEEAVTAIIEKPNALARLVCDNVPTKDNYVIVGWIYNNKAYSIYDDSFWDDVLDAEEITLIAVWEYDPSDWSPEI